MDTYLRPAFALAIAVLAATAFGNGHAAAGALADLPMSLLGDRVAVVQADTGARHGLNFIIDTGASDEILDAALVKELGVTVTEPKLVPQPGGAVAIGQTTGVDIALGGVALKSWPFVSAPLRPLEPFLGRPFDGVFGQAFLDRFVVEFDYAHGRMRLYDPATYVYSGTGSVLALERPDGRFFIRARLEGTGRESAAEGLLQLDTGSFEALGLDGGDVAAHGLVSRSAPRVALFGLALGGETSGYKTRLRGVVLGPIRIASPIAAVTTSSNAGDDPLAFGVVGGEILRRFKVIVLASRKQIILEPTPALRQPFAFDANGLILKSPRPFDHVLVHAVLENSPGARAGLREGDEIVALDGRTVGVNGLDATWHALQAPGRHHQLKIRRGAETLSLSVLTKPILR